MAYAVYNIQPLHTLTILTIPNRSKLTLHASLHEKVAQHKVVLGERDAMLKNMREKLVKDSGLVLGGGSKP